MRRAFFKVTVTRTHILLFLARWVARSSVDSRIARGLPGRHSSVTASPLRCRTGLSVGRRGSGRPPPWCPQGGLFARRHTLDTGELMWTSVKRVGTRGRRPPAGAVENMRRLGLIRPRDPSWCPVTLSSEGRPLLAVSGSSWGPAPCVIACSLDSVWSSAIAGAQATGACSRLSPPVPGPHGGRGHTCRTPPWACSVSSQSDASRKRVW